MRGFTKNFFSLLALICLLQSPFRGLGQSLNDTLRPHPTLSYEERDSVLHPTRLDKYYVYSGILDARDQVVSPFHWNGTQWITAGVLAGSECALIFANGDKNIHFIAQRNRTNFTNHIENDIGDPFGDGIYPAIIVGSSYIIGCIFHKDHPKHLAMLSAKSLAISGATCFIIKSVAERYRPDQGDNPEHWLGPKGMFSLDAYPSGHATVAFATAGIIAMEYPRPLIIPILAYSLATITAYGRINGNYHWGSDVLLGGAIGYFTSRLVFHHDNWKKCRKRMHK